MAVLTVEPDEGEPEPSLEPPEEEEEEDWLGFGADVSLFFVVAGDLPVVVGVVVAGVLVVLGVVVAGAVVVLGVVVGVLVVVVVWAAGAGAVAVYAMFDEVEAVLA